MKFVNPTKIVSLCDIQPGNKVTDLGCGAGFYSLAAAKLVGNAGRVAAIDIQDSKLAATKSAAVQHGLHNLEVYRQDLEKPISIIAPGGENLVILASIIHEVKNLTTLLANAYALLATGGKLLVVDWKLEPSPFGPAMNKRVDAGNLRQQLESIGFRHSKDIDADKFHYAMVFIKQ